MTNSLEDMREAAARVCDEQAESFFKRANFLANLGDGNNIREVVALGKARGKGYEKTAAAIRALPIPDDPRDAEIAELREALRRQAVYVIEGRRPPAPDQWYCEECDSYWLGKDELHAPGCLAAPIKAEDVENE